MNPKEKVSKEAMAKANQFIANIFPDDIDGIYGRFAFLHKPPFKENPWLTHQGDYSYSLLERNLGVSKDEYKSVLRDNPIGRISDFFKEGAKIAIIGDDESLVEGLREKYKRSGAELTFFDIHDLENDLFEPSEEFRKKFGRILVDSIGQSEKKNELVKNIKKLAKLGDRKGSTILRTQNIEQNLFGPTSPQYIFAHGGWDVYVPNMQGRTSDLIIARL